MGPLPGTARFGRRCGRREKGRVHVATARVGEVPRTPPERPFATCQRENAGPALKRAERWRDTGCRADAGARGAPRSCCRPERRGRWVQCCGVVALSRRCSVHCRRPHPCGELPPAHAGVPTAQPRPKVSVRRSVGRATVPERRTARGGAPAGAVRLHCFPRLPALRFPPLLSPGAPLAHAAVRRSASGSVVPVLLQWTTKGGPERGSPAGARARARGPETRASSAHQPLARCPSRRGWAPGHEVSARRAHLDAPKACAREAQRGGRRAGPALEGGVSRRARPTRRATGPEAPERSAVQASAGAPAHAECRQAGVPTRVGRTKPCPCRVPTGGDQ